MRTDVYIETEECIGCESCVEFCPEVFGFKKETEKAYILDSSLLDDQCIEDAIETCPVECIYQE